MAKNELLERVVINQLYEHLKEDPQLIRLGDGEEEFMKSLIQGMGTLAVDQLHKVRHHFGENIGYGYDFNAKSDEDRTPRDIYEQALETGKKLSGKPNFEVLVSSGVVDNRFGWYITKP